MAILSRGSGDNRQKRRRTGSMTSLAFGRFTVRSPVRGRVQPDRRDRTRRGRPPCMRRGTPARMLARARTGTPSRSPRGCRARPRVAPRVRSRLPGRIAVPHLRRADRVATDRDGDEGEQHHSDEPPAAESVAPGPRRIPVTGTDDASEPSSDVRRDPMKVTRGHSPIHHPPRRVEGSRRRKIPTGRAHPARVTLDHGAVAGK